MPVELMYCTAAKSSTTVAGSPSATARSYALVRVSAAWPSISPDSVITAPPGRIRTSASHVVFTRTSFACIGTGPHDQPDRVPRSLSRHVHGVHHVPDEEQPPAARGLFTRELPGEIGFLCFFSRPGRRLRRRPSTPFFSRPGRRLRRRPSTPFFSRPGRRLRRRPSTPFFSRPTPFSSRL